MQTLILKFRDSIRDLLITEINKSDIQLKYFMRKPHDPEQLLHLGL